MATTQKGAMVMGEFSGHSALEAGGTAQCLPPMHKALGSIPSTREKMVLESGQTSIKASKKKERASEPVFGGHKQKGNYFRKQDPMSCAAPPQAS